MAQNDDRRGVATPAALETSLPGDVREDSAPDDRRLVLTARAAWALAELRRAGPRGITARAYPGVRLADAVFKLRRAGYAVATEFEPHGGDYPGRHARYILHEQAADAAKGAA
ncbi:MAG: hypothetical protein ACFBWO_07650 [Paracoccaceae bacterium]